MVAKPSRVSLLALVLSETGELLGSMAQFQIIGIIVSQEEYHRVISLWKKSGVVNNQGRLMLGYVNI